MHKIITDLKALSDYTSRAIASYKSAATMTHIALVSALHHAAQHGISDDNHPLNVLYDNFRPNDRQAVRQYLNRTFLVLGGMSIDDINGTPTTEAVKAALAEGTWLGFDSRKSMFFVKKGMTQQRADFVKLATDHLINPDGKNWVRYCDRSNVSELKKFGDNEVLAAVQKAFNTATGGSSKVDANVSQHHLIVLADTIERLGGDRPVIPVVKNTNMEQEGSLVTGEENIFHPVHAERIAAERIAAERAAA